VIDANEIRAGFLEVIDMASREIRKVLSRTFEVVSQWQLVDNDSTVPQDSVV